MIRYALCAKHGSVSNILLKKRSSDHANDQLSVIIRQPRPGIAARGFIRGNISPCRELAEALPECGFRRRKISPGAEDRQAGFGQLLQMAAITAE